MADRIRINTDRLGTDAARIQGYIGNIMKEMSDMKQSVSALEHMWEGPGQSAFHKAFWNDMEAVEQAAASLKELYEYNTNAKTQYEQCDRKVASMIADMKV